MMNRRAFLKMLGAGAAVVASFRLSHLPELISEGGSPEEPSMTTVYVTGVVTGMHVCVLTEDGELLFNDVVSEPEEQPPFPVAFRSINFDTTYRGEVTVRVRNANLLPYEWQAVVMDGPSTPLINWAPSEPFGHPAMQVWAGDA
jgi:hypothetical protein